MYFVEEVKSKTQLREFMNLASLIYGTNHPKFVYPMKFHLKMMLGNLNSNDKKILLARDGDLNTVARIAFKEHRQGDKIDLHFGFFECLQGHSEAVTALFDYGQKCFPDLSFIRIRGPFHFRQEDPYVGLLEIGRAHV